MLRAHRSSKEKPVKNKLTTALLVVILLAGLSLLLYPTVSDYWNSMHASAAIASYSEKVNELDTQKYEELLEAAREYNRDLARHESFSELSPEQKARYESLLDIDGTGIMGYIEIPNIDLALPIYHGTEESVLQIAAGHLEQTSLPVGGESTHCVLSGHRGLPSAKLFTNLDKLVEGDTFVIRVLDEVMTYEVTQILIVEPDDTEALKIVEGEDMCTLVTCTPYGINTQRLLVIGRRTENAPDAKSIRVVSDATRIEPLIVAPALALPVLLVLVAVLLLKPNGRSKESENEKNK